MKLAVLTLLILGGAFGAWASVEPIASLALDTTPPQPVECFLPGVECFDYTLSVSYGDLADIQSVTIDNVGGILPIEFSANFWLVSVSGTNITFTNPFPGAAFETGTSLDGFLIESSDTSTVAGTYTYMLASAPIDPGGDVPVPGAATPEPASVGLVGLGLLALVGAKKRFASR